MSLGLTFFNGVCLGFFNLKDLIPADVFQRLANAAWPANFDGLGRGLGSQSEMHAFVAGRKITGGRRYGRPL